MTAAEFQYRPEDYAALNRLLAERSVLVRRGGLLNAGLMAAIFALAAALTEWPGGARWPVLVAALLGFGAGAVLHRLVGRQAARWGARLQGAFGFALARRQGLIVPQRLEIAPEGLRAVSEKGETLTRWAAVREVARSGEHVFLFVAPRLAYIVPGRALPDPRAFEAFGEAAEARWREAQGAPTPP